MKTLGVIGTILLLSGCAASLEDIPVDNKNQQCVRQCTVIYSDCISRSVGGRMAQNACKESYRVCINTCPSK